MAVVPMTMALFLETASLKAAAVSHGLREVDYDVAVVDAAFEIVFEKPTGSLLARHIDPRAHEGMSLGLQGMGHGEVRVCDGELQYGRAHSPARPGHDDLDHARLSSFSAPYVSAASHIARQQSKVPDQSLDMFAVFFR